MLTKMSPGDSDVFSAAPHLCFMKNQHQIMLNAQECDKPNKSTKNKRPPAQKYRMNSVLESKSEFMTPVL